MPIAHRIILALVSTACLAASSEAATAPPATIQSYDIYKAWLVACDNALSCVAKGFGDGTRAELKVERAAGPRGSLAVTLSADHRFALGDVMIDGSAAGLSSQAWKVDASDDMTSASTSDLSAIRALVDRLRNASTLTMGGDAEVPLGGFAAAMLRLDERQGRLDGMTALLRPGSLAASRVPSAPTLPRVPDYRFAGALSRGEALRLIAAVRKRQAALLAKEDCETDIPMPPSAYALDTKRALVLMPCIMGAYQGSSLAFIARRDGGSTMRLLAPTPYIGNARDSGGDVDYFTEASIDPKTGELSMAAKGRGLADCGMSASWIWNGERFVLSDLTLQQACGGTAPGDWPVLYRSRE